MSDAWLVRINALGIKIWERTFGGKKVDQAFAVVTVPGGGFMVAGLTHSKGAGNADAWLIRIDKRGNPLWEKTFGGKGFDAANALALVPGGGFIIAGETRSKGAGKTDAWLLRLDAKGQLLWEKTYGGINHDRFISVKPTPDWGFIVAGSKNSTGTDGKKGGRSWVLKVDGQGRYRSSER
ncbi:MAG: hypothetical protein IIC13_17590 [SAR324 cluster bacterium]|nr:hypothetical protein [SAR324 cluster bacterium]